MTVPVCGGRWLSLVMSRRPAGHSGLRLGPTTGGWVSPAPATNWPDGAVTATLGGGSPGSTGKVPPLQPTAAARVAASTAQDPRAPIGLVIMAPFTGLPPAVPGAAPVAESGYRTM